MDVEFIRSLVPVDPEGDHNPDDPDGGDGHFVCPDGTDPELLLSTYNIQDTMYHWFF